ncbi:MAG: potassium-transporting ATPase subunit KdpA [Eubacteriales bacterium]|nr:potassium-transporting ATPase subunit KdpA [Eubacteriales bacterium]
MMAAFIQYAVYMILLVGIGIPLGAYMGKVMNGEKVFLSKLISPCERLVYKITGIDSTEEMSAGKYILSAVVFNVIGFAVLFVLLLCQGFLPLNPEKIPGNSWHLAFNTAASFITNTNWQAYSGESALSYLSQMMGLAVQNFVSAATGIAVLFAVIRGFVRVKTKGIGNFWVDLTRSVLYILMPISLVGAILIASQGVVQSFGAYDKVELVEPLALDENGEIMEDAVVDRETGAVTVNGEPAEAAQLVTEQVVPLGPAASQISIKQLGTNGGGFFGVNSAHPFENPTIFSNLIEMLFLLIIPVGLCFTFGRNVKDKRQGVAVFLAMFIMLAAALSVCAVSEQKGTPQLADNGAVAITSTDGTAGGNMEGKETRFGIATSATWTTWTTAASNGSVNAMHDSYTPIGGLVPMLLMQLGEVVFGGVGCGLYGMLAFAILAVFIAGLMVGRTPEYLGKKIEPFEMKMAVLCCLATPIVILIGSGIAALLPSTVDSLNNPGAHGLSEVLYAYSSAGGNNGSAFAGFNANTPFINVSIGLVMLAARFIPLVTMLLIAGSMAAKKKVAATAGTLSTCNALFVFLLIFVVLLVGALSFFPALSLGPIAEYFQMIA